MDSTEKLLGKRGSIKDKHSAAAKDLMDKLGKIRRGMGARRLAWDELSCMIQVVHRGVIGYVPLVGLPSALALHEEEAALQRMILQSLGVRVTAERVSLTVGRAAGGLQCASIVEVTVGSAAKDLVILVNGSSDAALLARDFLRSAMAADQLLLTVSLD